MVALALEARTESIFHTDSYGYRPGKSPLDAVRTCRERCWKKNWVVDLDIQKFFDSIDHDLMVKSVKANTDQKWVVLYVERWLKAPLRLADGTLQVRDRGTPQGSAVSPVLANLFLHYAMDSWLVRGKYLVVPWKGMVETRPVAVVGWAGVGGITVTGGRGLPGRVG